QEPARQSAHPGTVQRGLARLRYPALGVCAALLGLLCGALAWEQREAMVARLARWSHALHSAFMLEPSPPPAREPSSARTLEMPLASAASGSSTPQDSNAPIRTHPSAAIVHTVRNAVESPVPGSLSPTSKQDLGLRQSSAAETREATAEPKRVLVQPGETLA